MTTHYPRLTMLDCICVTFPFVTPSAPCSLSDVCVCVSTWHVITVCDAQFVIMLTDDASRRISPILTDLVRISFRRRPVCEHRVVCTARGVF